MPKSLPIGISRTYNSQSDVDQIFIAIVVRQGVRYLGTRAVPMERSNSMAAQRRLAALTAQVGAPDARLAPEPAAGVLSWLGGLFGGGDAEDDDVPEVADAAVVRGVVKQCFLADEEWAGLEVRFGPAARSTSSLCVLLRDVSRSSTVAADETSSASCISGCC